MRVSSIIFWLSVLSFVWISSLPAQDAAGLNLSWAQVSAVPYESPDVWIPYGTDSLQSGALYLPQRTDEPAPVVVLLHGGCWLSQYSYRYMTPMARTLADHGFAVWLLRYRRVGDSGGGWPGTFEDIAAGTDHLRILAETHPLDLNRVVFAGHSAGGHLALWLAVRHQLPATSSLYVENPLRPFGVIGLAAITNLNLYAETPGSCNQAVPLLMDGMPDAHPERYAQASPHAFSNPGVPVRLIAGETDRIVPLFQAEQFAQTRQDPAGSVTLHTLAGAGHFDLITPVSFVWTDVLNQFITTFK